MPPPIRYAAIVRDKGVLGGGTGRSFTATEDSFVNGFIVVSIH